MITPNENLESGAGKAWVNSQNADKERVQETVMCTAGSSYLVVNTSGGVTRCFHDLDQIGTVHDLAEGRVELQGPTPCRVGKICDTSGDLMFASTWEGSKYHEAPMTNWRESFNYRKAKREHLYTVVFVSDKCNFNCPYCCNFYPQEEDQPRPSQKELAWEDYLAYVKVMNRFKTVQLNFNGGEPFVWKHMSEACNLVAHDTRYEIAINTNLSIGKVVRELPASPVIKRHKISSSIHPVDKRFSLDRFLENAQVMMEKGWWVRAHIISWPQHLEWWDNHAEEVKKMGIDLWLKPVGGYKFDDKFWAEVRKRNEGYWNTPDYLHSINWTVKPPIRSFELPGGKDAAFQEI